MTSVSMANVGPEEPPAGWEAEPARRYGSAKVPPHNLVAEESLLGAMLLSRSAIADSRVVESDFYKPAHGAIFEAIAFLFEHGEPIDPVSVSNVLRENGTLERLGGRQALLRLQAATPASANARHYSKIVVELAARRNLIRAAGDIAELGYDEEVPTADALLRAHEYVSQADIPLGGIASPNIEEFLSVHHEYEWVLPDLLETGDRLLLVAPEKYGKSTLNRQVAVCASQGIDPFRFHAIPRVNVVLFDFENPASLTRRKMRPLVNNCANTLELPFDADRLRVEARPEGIDLTDRVDEMWLYERMAANREIWARQGWEKSPTLVIIGPIYKMLDDEDDRRQVANLQHCLDRLRGRFSCALIMETHAPQESFAAKAPPRSLRPYGARRWLRWPEFCRAIEPAPDAAPGVADFYDVQGARDERPWPWRLQRGAGRWPWSAYEERSIAAAAEEPF